MLKYLLHVVVACLQQLSSTKIMMPVSALLKFLGGSSTSSDLSKPFTEPVVNSSINFNFDSQTDAFHANVKVISNMIAAISLRSKFTVSPTLWCSRVAYGTEIKPRAYKVSSWMRTRTSVLSSGEAGRWWWVRVALNLPSMALVRRIGRRRLS